MMLKMNRTLLLVILVAISAQGRAEKKAPTEGKIKVFVFTNGVSPEGFTDGDKKQRADSVKDLKSEIKGNLLELVEDRTGADISIEVVDRNYASVGTTTKVRNGASGTVEQTTPNKAGTNIVRTIMRVGDYVREFEGTTPPGCAVGCWRFAASAAKDQVEKWVKENYDAIIAHRSKR